MGAVRAGVSEAEEGPATPGESVMAERKAALTRAPERPKLEMLLERARTVVLSDEQLQEQRASFVYGNAPKGSRITKDSARKAAGRLRITDARP
jgi:hypothetical protein